jgi:transcriptional regulator with XRE-family HTH domain
MTHPIANYRQRHGLTLEQFGVLVGVNKATVLKWERGSLRPGIDVMARVVAATHGEVSARELRPDIFAALEAA